MIDDLFSSPVPPVGLVFIITLVAGWRLRRLAPRLLVGIGAPLLIAFVRAGPRDFIFGTGEVGGWTRLIFAWLSLLGLVAAAVGLVLGYWLRRWLSPASH